MKPTLTFEEDGHRYLLNGKEVPSVTQIIKATIGVHFEAEDWYLQRGAAVHAAAALIARGKEFSHDPATDEQVRALRRFFAEVKPVVKFTERRVASPIYRFAGTLDLLAFIGKHLCIVDYKGSMDLERCKLQLAGYSIALAETDRDIGAVNKGVGVEIREDGQYRMTPILDLRPAKHEFLAMRAVYGIMERVGKLNNNGEGK